MKNINSYFEIAKIIAKNKNGEISDKEKDILNSWLKESDNNKKIFEKLQDEQYLHKEIELLKTYSTDKAYKAVAKDLQFGRTNVLNLSRNFYKYAAIIAFLIISTFFVISTIDNKQSNTADNQITAGSKKAILTTANNDVIELGKSNNKKIFAFKRATVTDENSILEYKTKDTIKKSTVKIEYNQLETPRGGEYSLILTDGTKIQLNSDTKLKYPVAFSGDTRVVILEGEAYFEIAKSESTPFIVKTNNLDIKVYGTSFNVAAYPEEDIIQTTLVEGSVGLRYNNGFEEIKIIPGTQANYTRSSGSIETKDVDTYLYTAWTKGVFAFENEPINSILAKLSRWYNFEYEFINEDIKNQRFTGSLKKYESIDQILEMISMTSEVKLKIDNNKIIIYSLEDQK